LCGLGGGSGGRDVTVVVGNKDLADWAKNPVKRFPEEEKTTSTVAETVPSEQFGQGSVYRMERTAPDDRRQADLESIEFIGNGTCVPILLGITGVMEW
jgi:hypothetical protein